MNNRLEKCISCDHSDFKFYADNVSLKLPIFICQNCKLYVTGKSQNELDEPTPYVILSWTCSLLYSTAKPVWPILLNKHCWYFSYG